MSTPLTMDETLSQDQSTPGAQLRALRLQKGHSVEYVAGKLHLRVRVIELIEADAYHSLPESVFITGYLRAYAKLLGADPEPLMVLFHEIYKPEHTPERALWQSTRRETHHGEHVVRWLTGFFAVIVLGAVATWWYANKDNERLFPANPTPKESALNKTETEIRLTDLSKMRSLLSSHNQLDTLEKPGE